MGFSDFSNFADWIPGLMCPPRAGVVNANAENQENEKNEKMKNEKREMI